jgi:hypothetical protein
VIVYTLCQSDLWHKVLDFLIDLWDYKRVKGTTPMSTLCTQEFATPEHFDRWESHAKTLDAYSLKYIIKECYSAAEAMKGFNPIREGYYLDQAATYGMELTRRNRNLPAGLRHRI